MTPNQPNKVLKAVALKYELNTSAPRVTGQGEGYVAEAILAKAKEFGIPTRNEPELVEFLMQLKLNDVVPPDLYAAVAEVLAWAYEIDGKAIPEPPKNWSILWITKSLQNELNLQASNFFISINQTVTNRDHALQRKIGFLERNDHFF